MEKQVYLKESEFDLQKVKFDKDEMLAEFIAVRQANEGVTRTPMTMRPTLTPHPDLKDIFDVMKPYVLKQYDYHKLFVARTDLKKEDKSKTSEAWAELLRNVTVTGFTLTGSENLKGAIITAKLKTESGTRAMPTGRIVFSSDKLGYEKEVEALIEEAQTEVYRCLFENKRSQLDMFDQDPAETKESKKEAKLGLVS